MPKASVLHISKGMNRNRLLVSQKALAFILSQLYSQEDVVRLFVPELSRTERGHVDEFLNIKIIVNNCWIFMLLK